MFKKFENVCEAILESNKGDMDTLKSQMKEAFGLKDQNFSAVNMLPDNTARLQIIVPGNKQFTDEVMIIDAKNGKFNVNSLTLHDEKTTSIENVMEFITVSDENADEPEGEESEETPEPKPEGEEPAPEGEETPEPTEEPAPEGEETPEPTPEPEGEKPKPEEEEEEEDEEKKKEGV